MADTMVYVGTHGGEDPYRAALLFYAARTMKQRHGDAETHVALLGDAVYLLNEQIAREAKPMKRDPIDKLITDAFELGITIHY